MLNEIKTTKETGKERGFHMCIEENGKLSAGDTCIGEECGMKFQDTSCHGKKIQGDFHTHPYLADIRKSFGITFKTSDELIRAATETFLEKRGMTPTIPSHADLRNAIIGRCAKRTEGTTCIGSDLDLEKVECWNIRHMDDGDCIRALMEYISPEEESQKLPKDWVRGLFDIEMIRLKRG